MDHDDHLRHVRADAERLLHGIADLSRAFHQRLFDLCPESTALFPLGPGPHHAAVEATLAVVLRNLDAIDALRGPLVLLGADHAARGVGPAMLRLAREILLDLIRTRTTSGWSPRSEAAWRQALAEAFEPLEEGARVALSAGVGGLGD
jgi:hemoglobin-like flavoprotein